MRASSHASSPEHGPRNDDASTVRTFLGSLPAQDLAFVVAVNVGVGSVPLVETISAALPMLDALRALAPDAIDGTFTPHGA